MPTESYVSFSPEVRRQMYEDIGGLISTYFMNAHQDRLGLYNLDLESYDYFFQTIKLNAMITMVVKLTDIIRKINLQINRDIEVEGIEVVNGIRGRLDINKYIKSRLNNVGSKRIFPCLVLNENYDIVENNFVILVVKYAFEIVKSIPMEDRYFRRAFENSSLYRALLETKKRLNEILHSGQFVEIIERIETTKLLDIEKIIQLSLRKTVAEKVKRKIINEKTYGALLKWWDRFVLICNGQFTDLHDNEFLFYGEQFDDKLYELWLLEGIKNSFISDYGLEIEEVNPLWRRTEDFIYKLRDQNQNVYKIYFQKSSGLMWDNTEDGKPKWRITNIDTNERVGFLEGNLDIILTMNDNEQHDPILIDAKNISYTISIGGSTRTNPSVTDKIYKMVGYIDNFNKKVSINRNALGIIVFTNLNSQSRIEKIFNSDEDDGKIYVFSIDPSSREAFQFINETIINNFS